MNEFESWNKKNEVFGLQLPDGWFGRPGDNRHRGTFILERDNKLILELDNQFYLVFTKPFDIKNSGDDLVISGFQQLTFDYQSYGDMKAHSKTFRSGEVILVSYSW